MRERKFKWAVIFIIGMIASFFIGCARTAIDERDNSLKKPDGAIDLQVSIAEVYGNAKAIVTIISDDGFYVSCKNLNRIFSERNLRCTVAGIVRIIKPHQNEWIDLLRYGSIELVSHSYNHIRMEDGRKIAYDINALKHEIVDADQWYEDWLGHEQIVFVCPENQMCENGYKIIENNNFWSVRRGQRGFNSLAPEEGIETGQWLNLRVQGICDDEVNTSVRNQWIDTAINNRYWLIEMWHNVMPSYDGGYQTILISDAAEHLDYVKKKAIANDIWVATYTEAVKYIREKQNTIVEAYIKDNELHIFAKLANSKMSYKTFNHPLTISVIIPDGWEVSKTDYTSVKNGILTVNVVPGKELIIDIMRNQ